MPAQTYQARLRNELHAVRQTLQEEENRRNEAEAEMLSMMKGVPESEDGFEVNKVPLFREHT